MRYSYTALVLATVSIAQAVAGPVLQAHHNHAHFHAKKDAIAEPLEVAAENEKREPGWQDINFATVAITYSAGQTWGEATAAAVAEAAPVATTAAAVVAAAATEAAKASTTASSEAASSSSEASTVLLTTADAATLTTLGFKSAGVNAETSAGGVWIGTDGPYTNKFINNAGEDVILVVWGPWGSWVNANVPLITVSLASGTYTTISFASGSIGAWAAIHADTELVNGQVSNTWGEYTFSEYGVVDVSREVNMNGHSLSIVGPTCTTDMTTCVFVCSSGDVCTDGYELLNCENGSQTGATYGLYDGAPSGGCGGLGSSASLVTTIEA